MTASDLLVFLLSSATSLRLIFYRRNGATFKRHISLIAWVLIVGTGSLALCLVTGKLNAKDLHPMLVFVLSFSVPIVFAVRGNIARLLRPPRPTLPARNHRHQ